MGYDAFTGRSLFARIVRRLETPEEAEIQETYFTQRSGRTRAQRSQERRQAILTGLVSTEQRQRQQRRLETLEGFLQAPLDRRRGGELSEIALTLLSTESEAAVLSEIEQWWQDWLKEYQIETLGSEEWEKLKRNTYFAILISVLDDRLSFLVDYLPAISRVIDLHDLSKRLVYRPPLDYLPVVPSAPVGNILGFRYLRDCVTQRGGKLEYFRYVGVGRALLLDFPTLFAVDNWKGPHTVLISGTSYAPGSPAYHIKEKPTVLLEPARNNRQAGDAGIAKSKFFFKPQLNGLNEGKYIALSGLLSSARREASGKLVKAICYTSGQAQSLLEKIFQDIEQNAETNPQWWRSLSGTYNRWRLL